ncbi:MAG: hypothetical protein LBT59_09880 [Clostridiales bacterium]|nr:hypothetical protein [Clostridiales bacterium]
MIKELEQYRAAVKDLPKGVVEAEAQAERDDLLSVTVSGGKQAGCEASDITTVFVRATGKKTGLAVTQNPDEDAYGIIRRAAEAGDYSTAATPETLNPSKGFLSESEIEHSSPKELLEFALDLENMILEKDPGLSTCVKLSETIRGRGICNSKGLNLCSRSRTVEVEVDLIRESPYGHFDFDFTVSAKSLKELTADRILEEHARWVRTQLPQSAIKPGIYRAAISASVMCNILLTAWQIFSGPFALAKNTPLAGRTGEKAFSELVGIMDIPELAGCGYRYPFDCEGSFGSATELVKSGCVNGFMHTLSSAILSGASATGNAGRKNLLSGTLHTQTQVIPKNFCLLPGEDSPEGLITKLFDGIWIIGSYDEFHSLNIASGAFNIPCKAALVKGGKLKGLAGGLTMNGNLIDLFASVEAVGNDMRTLPMIMLKSYTVSSPSVLVGQLAVSG